METSVKTDEKAVGTAVKSKLTGTLAKHDNVDNKCLGPKPVDHEAKGAFACSATGGCDSENNITETTCCDISEKEMCLREGTEEHAKDPSEDT